MPTFYFAYGSNLSRRQMRERCPNSTAIAPAVLKNYRWLIGERGYATLAYQNGTQTHGALYLLTPEDEATLDRAEGVAGGSYGKFPLSVECHGERVRAIVYIDPRCGKGMAKARYIRRCIAGAKAWKLPASAIRKMEKSKTDKPAKVESELSLETETETL